VRGPRLLAGDIGGTKTDLAIFDRVSGPRAPLVSGRLLSEQYARLEDLVHDFLMQHDLSIDYACFDVAGPVIDGHVKLTNLPWELDEATLTQALNVHAVWLLNDLLAIASAVPFLVPRDLHPLNAGTPSHGGTIAVIAPGTGLGEAFLTWDGARYHAYPSEGGHTDFGPINRTQVDLLLYLRDRFEHVSYERVCSGIGLPNIYQFLRDTQRAPESPVIAARLGQTPLHEQAHVIIDAALHVQPSDQLCAATVDLFVAILGAETANLLLNVLATGGVYMTGGIPLHIRPALERGTLMQAAMSKGRFADLIGQVPIQLITYPQVALLGAAGYGLEQMGAVRPLMHR
jgi:glucokinase